MEKFTYSPERRVYVAVKRIEGEYKPSFGHVVPSTIGASGSIGTSNKLSAEYGWQVPDTTNGLKPTAPNNSKIEEHINYIQDRPTYIGNITAVEFKDIKNNYNYRYDGKLLEIIKTEDMANGKDSEFSTKGTVLWLGQYKDGESYTWLIMSGSPEGQLREYDSLVYKRRSGSGMSGIYKTLESLASGTGTINDQALEYDFVKKVGDMLDDGYTSGSYGDIPSYHGKLAIGSAYLRGNASTIFTCEHYGAIRMVNPEFPIVAKESLLIEEESGGIVDKIIYARPYVVQDALEGDNNEYNDDRGMRDPSVLESYKMSKKYKLIFLAIFTVLIVISFFMGGALL